MQLADTFYLFETHVPFIFKYGYTSRHINARMSDYSGVGKPKQLIGHFTVASGEGIKTEQVFNDFLKNKNIQTIPKFGKEYFAYYDNANDLYNEFYNMKKDIQPNTCKKRSKIQRVPDLKTGDDILQYLNSIDYSKMINK